VLKNQVQAHTPIFDVARLRALGLTGTAAVEAATAVASKPGAAATAPVVLPLVHPTLLDRVRYLYFTHGLAGVYRGIGAGTARSMISNGVSMVVMLRAHRFITEQGWRN
jgi:hypothetical protein